MCLILTTISKYCHHSEVALDNDMIQQNETDLNERMNETVIEETEKLVVLESRSKTLKVKIDHNNFI